MLSLCSSNHHLDVDANKTCYPAEPAKSPHSLPNLAHCILLTNSIAEEIEEIEVGKCLLSFGAESFVFQVAIQKFKDQDI